jgi:hypothetical protein
MFILNCVRDGDNFLCNAHILAELRSFPWSFLRSRFRVQAEVIVIFGILHLAAILPPLHLIC